MTLSFTISKLLDLSRALKIIAAMTKALSSSHLGNFYFSANQGMQLWSSDSSCKAVLYFQLQPEYFEQWAVPNPIRVGLALSSFAEEIHNAYQVRHIKLLEVSSTPDGQLCFAGKNLNGPGQDPLLSPECVLPQMIPASSLSLIQQREYPFAIDFPSKLLHDEFSNHTASPFLTLKFDPVALTLRFSSEKNHGFHGTNRGCYQLEKDNLILLRKDEKNLRKYKAEEVTFDVKLATLLLRGHKLAHVVRIYMKTHAPLHVEYILDLHPTDPAKNSVLKLCLGHVVAIPHPSVAL